LPLAATDFSAACYATRTPIFSAFAFYYLFSFFFLLRYFRFFFVDMHDVCVKYREKDAACTTSRNSSRKRETMRVLRCYAPIL